ncbi:MAG: DUF4136 domain-containing protein [Bacteroidota bacterium]
MIQFVNDEADFGSYSTYLITNFKVSDTDISEDGELLLTFIETSMIEQMDKRGYNLAEREPDLLLRYELLANLNQRTNVDQSFYSPIVRVNTTTFRESALLLELTDRRTRKLVWQASIDLKESRKKPTEVILQEAITKMYDTYLYRAKKTEQDPSLAIHD